MSILTNIIIITYILSYIHLYDYSNDRKKYICTRCLSNFNFERTIRDHIPRCPNEVKKGNLIDQLRTTGGFWKEQRRRHLERSLRHSRILKQELEKMNETESVEFDEFKPNATEVMITQN